jgi:murein L,D-transpeptidase YafK
MTVKHNMFYLILFLLLALLGGGYMAAAKLHRAQPTEGQTPLPFAKVDSFVVYKSRQQMLVFAGGRQVRAYNVALGDPVGHKVQQGDRRTPEGRYFITYKNTRSSFYKSLLISYPNQADRRSAQKLGVNPGGDICIHGVGQPGAKNHYLVNWTLGCIAVTNEEVDEFFDKTKLNTLVVIYP